MVGMIAVKQKESSLIGYCANYMTLTFDLTHDIDLGILKSGFEIAVSQEWVLWLMLNGKEAHWSNALTTPMTLDFQGQI